MKRLAQVPVFALVLAVLGIQATVPPATNELGNYDEGLLVTNAFSIGRGLVPHRDFYSNYPPGSSLLVWAGGLLSGGHTIHTMRVMALVLRIAGAVLAAILVGRLTRGRARVATFAAILLLQTRLELSLYAYVTALTVALAGVVALPSDLSKRGRFAASGVFFGLVTWFRHDLFVYAAVVAAALALAARLAGRPLIAPVPREGRRAFAVGLLAAIVPFWGVLFLLAGPSRVFHDLLIDQAKYTMPARRLPMPSFAGEHAVGLFRWTIPTWLTDNVTLGLAALALGVACGAVQFALPRWRTGSREHHRQLVAALLLSLAVATAPQALQRTDFAHVGYGIPPVLACIFGALGAVPMLSEALLFVAFIPFVTNPPAVSTPDELPARLVTQPDENYIPGDRRTLAAAIDRITGPNDKIFVGCTSHSRLIINWMAVYFESRRLGATRIQQFDPGLVTRDEVQQQMISELEAHHPAAVVLASGCLWDEPNESRKPGSDRLDHYIAAHYQPVEQISRFQILRPR